MTNEEKKALEIIKFLQDKCIQEKGIGMMTIYRVDEIANAIETALNLIETQQKEIEEKDNLILDMKEKLNNISFEVETMWRKIEKVDNNV